MDALRDAKDAAQILSVIQPLTALDGTKLKEELYAIPATQMLHKIMFHETSIAKKSDMDLIEDEDSEMTVPENGQTDQFRPHSVLNYIATNKITSTLGTLRSVYHCFIYALSVAPSMTDDR